jgi:hypothetical protein
VTVLQALRFVFWGALIVVVCVQLGSLDLFNDVVGFAVIAMGMIALVKNSVGGHRSLLTRLIALVAVLNALWAPFVQGPGTIGLAETIINNAFDVLNAFAVLGFCVVMRRFCETTALPRSGRSWKKSQWCWMVGLPFIIGKTCLSWWAVKDSRGVISQALTPAVIWFSLGALFLITLFILAHTFFSLGRTIASLKGMVRELPAANDFGLEEVPGFQFSIRAVMIVTAAVAVGVGGLSQGTVPYWRITMAGLAGLCLFAMWFDHEILSKGLLVATGCALLFGHVQPFETRSSSGSLCGTSAGVMHSYREEKLLPESTLDDIDAWLMSHGFRRSDPPTDPPPPMTALREDHPKPDVTIWYARGTPSTEEIHIGLQYSKRDSHLQFLDMDITSYSEGFGAVGERHERRVKQFKKEIVDWWREYYDRLQTSHSKP